MKIDVKNIDLWSKMGPRATFGMCLLEIQKEFENLQIVTSDVSTSAGLDRFKKNYPEKYTDVGIFERQRGQLFFCSSLKLLTLIPSEHQR